jgi:hypothetical protein
MQMQKLEPSLEYFGPLEESFRDRAYELLSWGYQGARPLVSSAREHEPAITGYICRTIKDKLRSLKRPIWCAYYHVEDDPPVEKKDKSGRSRPRADIIIVAGFDGRPELMFEAKRLRRNGFGTDKYVDTDGMGCFISGLYASRYDEAVMLGYVQSDSVNFWEEEIKRAIDNEVTSLQLRENNIEWKSRQNFPSEWISKHSRISVDRNITIYHILLDFVYLDSI